MALGTDFIAAVIDRAHLAEASAAVRSAALAQVSDHVAAMKSRLESSRPGILAWLDKNQHARVWPMPHPMMGVLGDHDVAPLGYWEHSKDVVGATGRYTALEYSARIDTMGLTNALKRNSIKTSIPCPVCSQPAAVAVTILPADESFGVWSLECSTCGHKEAVQDAPDMSFTASAPALTCKCKACAARGDELFSVYGPRATRFPELMDNVLIEAAGRLMGHEPGWTLAHDGTAHFGEGLAGRYFEVPVQVAAGTARGSFYSSLPADVKAQLGSSGVFSALLERTYGVDPQLSYCAIPAFDGSAGWQHTFSMARVGFDPSDGQSFLLWAEHAVAFALSGTLVLPMLVTVPEPSRLVDAPA
ncbi:hypothetical protein [Massilia cavernae]|uniref:Uncharacterized protein n=1 Tax=Massilia cavernae TaxID=2320864 RepID=A0A418XFT3_9BURK|nr:hypothetical protein [Massilia cavernae]RJG11322.1 hypothetical protein D3872_20310 [Massilia cavernae]